MTTFDFSLDAEILADDIHLIDVAGEIDLFTAPDVREAASRALDAGAMRIVVDLTDVRFLDSTGLGVLIGILKRVRPAGGRLVVVNTNATTAATFSITGLDDVLEIASTRDEALQRLRGGPSVDGAIDAARRGRGGTDGRLAVS